MTTRRTFVCSIVTIGSTVGVAGCMDDLESGAGTQSETEGDSGSKPEEGQEGPVELVDALLTALLEGDLETANSLTHADMPDFTEADVIDDDITINSIDEASYDTAVDHASGLPPEDELDEEMGALDVSEYRIVTFSGTENGEQIDGLVLVIKSDGRWQMYDPLAASAEEEERDEETQEPYENVQVEEIAGLSGESEPAQIQQITITVSRGPESDEVDLSKATIDLTTNNLSETLAHNNSGNQYTFSTSVISGDDDVVLADDDQSLIEIDLDSISQDANLGAGETISFEISSRTGVDTWIEVRTGSTIEPSETYILHTRE